MIISEISGLKKYNLYKSLQQMIFGESDQSRIKHLKKIIINDYWRINLRLDQHVKLYLKINKIIFI